ncbi:glycosyltransferase [Allosalinactinospora lopnorensis]|uniref:glycosyltransferase n=1 Tax=Allosalinactinospora lopnorensis TaxID=1352348 RepID=UPI000623C124|nr:glycosyltransferase [Allosalinactinospora lopnorensis]
MRITYLLTGGDAVDGAEAAVLSQTARLGERHEAEIITVFRTVQDGAPDPRVPVRYLVDARAPVQRPTRDCTLDEETCRTLSGEPSELLPASRRSGFSRLTDIELRHALARIGTDVLVGTTPALTSLIARLAPAGAVTVGQEYRVSELRGAGTAALLSYAPWLDALVVVSEPTRSWLAASLGAAAPRLETIPLAAPSGFRPRSGLRTRRILVAQPLVPEKQTDHAILAFAKVAAAHPDWSLRIRGSGPDLPRLRALVHARELHDRVEFLDGDCTVAEEWAKASICLLLSGTEAFGPALTEAFAAGVPAVCYDCANGPAEVVRHGTDGLLVPAGDVDGLASALGTLMADDATRFAWGAAALDGVDRFSPELITARWEALYADLLTIAPRDRARARADRAARHAAATARRGALFQELPWEQTTSQVPDMAAEEERVHRHHPHLIRSGGQLTGIRDDLPPHGALRANLDLIVRALDYFGVPYALVRDDGPRHRVMVTEERSAAALAALTAAYDNEPVYAKPLRPRGRLPQPVLAGMVGGMTGISGVRVFRPVITSGRTLRYGAGYGADLEFWSWDEDGGCYVAPCPSAIGDRIPPEAMTPASLRVADRDYPSYEPFARRLLTDVDFPVDAVYTWDGGSDPAAGERPADAAGDHRPGDAEKLRYSVRSVAMFAPWIRRIFVVTENGAPEWLETAHPGITVLPHRELAGAGGTLPLFAPLRTGPRLHTIDGLSEHFLHLRADVFIGRPLAPGHFFHSNGMARFFRSPVAVPLGKPAPDDPADVAAAKRNRALIEDAFQRRTTHGFRYAPSPLRRSVLAEIEERFPSELAATADASASASLHHHYGYLTGRSVPGELRCSRVDAGVPEQHPELNRLLHARDQDSFCVTESASEQVLPGEQRRMIHAFLRSYFPIASPYERPPP